MYTDHLQGARHGSQTKSPEQSCGVKGSGGGDQGPGGYVTCQGHPAGMVSSDHTQALGPRNLGSYYAGEPIRQGAGLSCSES